MSDNYKTIHLCVRGKVQGVAYRAWMVRLANKLQVKGWVRNQHDGSVEALLQGPSKSVNELLEACRSGPPAAKVVSVERREVSSYENERVEGFRQLTSD